MKRRIGRFSVTDSFEESPLLRAVLARCDVIERKANPPHHRTDYVAYSPDFDPADLAGEIPAYDWMIHTQSDGSFTVEAKRYIPDPEMQARIARLLEGLWD